MRGIRRYVSKISSIIFEDLYCILNKEKPCSKILEYDLFDGKEYTIDKFYDKYRIYFDKPCEFYKDYRYNVSINLRDSIHPKEKRLSKVPTRMMLFDSPIKTEWEETNLVPFKWFSDERMRSPIILLFAPGWGRKSQSFEEQMCYRLQRRGIDAGLMTVPYQHARTPAGSYTGEYFISANIFWTIANFRHFVSEIRLLIQYMRNHYKYVGLIGWSSGGFQTALASNCEEVEFLFSCATGCQLGSITWHGLITQLLRKSLETKGINEDSLNKVWSITDEINLAKHCKAKYRKNYITLYDKVIPPECQFKLWDVLGKPDKTELHCSHSSSYFVVNTVIDDMARFVRRCV